MGKSAGKTILAIGGFFLGAANPGWFGVGAGSANAALIGGLYGAAIGSSLWAATHQPDTQSYSVTFDQITNSVSSRDRIPVIYGKRKWGGNKTYHKTSDDKQVLTEDIVWCEADIDAQIYDVRANDIPILTIKETKTTNVLSIIYNGSSTMASYSLSERVLTLYEDSNEHVSFQCENVNVSEISSSINSCPGWNSNVLDNTAKGSEIDSISNVNAKNTTTTLTKTKTTTIQKGLDGCSFTFVNGDTNPDNYLETGGYRGCAWSRFTLKAGDNISGTPTITAIIKGKHITDTRTNIYDYSSNPSMCVRDYLLSKRYGCGHFIDTTIIDEDSFKEVADYCDELVTTKVPTTLSTADEVNAKILELQRYTSANNISGDELTKVNDEIARLQNSLISIQSNQVIYTLEVTKRYELNIIISEDKSHLEILSDIMAVFGGFLVFTSNKVSLRCEKATSVSYNFDDTNIVQDTLVHTQYPIDNSPNRFSVTFYDPDNQYTGVKILVEDTVNQAERGKIIEKQVDLVGCTSQSQALRLARMYRDKTALSQIVVSFDTATQAMHLEPGDVITVTKYIYPSGQKTLLFDKVPFRILEISEENEIYTIKGEQYNASIYNDALGAKIQVKNYVNITNPYTEVVQDVTNIVSSQEWYRQKDGTIVSNLNISFDLEPMRYFRQVYVYISTDNGVSWINYGITTEDKFTISNALTDKTYLIKLIVENTVGRKSSGVISNPIYITGKNTPPPDVTYFNVILSRSVLYFQWTSVYALDLDYYEIRVGTSFDTGTLVARILNGLTYNTNVYTGGNMSYWIKAVDTSGNYSDKAKEFRISLESSQESIFSQSFSINKYGGSTPIEFDIGTIELNSASNGSIVISYEALYMDSSLYMDASFFMDIVNNSLLDNNSSITFYVRTSLDGQVYSEWEECSSKEYTFKYAQVKGILDCSKSSTPANNYVGVLSVSVVTIPSIGSISENTTQYKFTQSTSSDTWVINHNLDKNPSVVVYDSDGDIVNGYVTYSGKTMTIEFGISISGIAYYN